MPDIAQAYRDDTRHILPIAAALYVVGMSLEAFLHVGGEISGFVSLHLLLALGSAGVLLASKYWRAFYARPELGALLLWLMIVASIGFHVVSNASSDHDLSRLMLTGTILGTAALILPTAAGLAALILSSLFLFWLFWYSEAGGLIENFSIPLVITFIALLIRSARRWGIEQRVIREKLMRDLQEQELRTAVSEAAAETATQLSTRFAHHFNNQLQPVVLGVDGASMGLAKEHPSMVFLDAIRVSALRGAKMIEGLLRYADSRPLKKTQFESMVLINELCLDKVVSDNICLSQDIENITIYADRDQVAVAVEELVVNANRAMTGRAGEIHLSVSELDEYVDIIVADEGEGLPVDLATSATQPFITDDPITRFGLGLTFVESVAMRHDGLLSVMPREPRGVIVRLRLKATYAQYVVDVIRVSAPENEL